MTKLQLISQEVIQ